ncbi:MAG: ABC transporter ATP-binding protein [Peptococcaceae bacterium]|nr:ABC transporter ATP-binding protein [Peptococcaceae bacterium]
MTNALELRKVTKIYRLHGQEVAALAAVDWVLLKGVMAAVVGASGSGKTTLLNIIGGLDRPSSGEVILSGQPIHHLAEGEMVLYRRKLLGYVFQSYNLIPNFSALENVELPLEFARYPARERKERARKCLQMAELPENRFRHRPAELSGGEQQRVAIARALANDPGIILADEPTGNLDSKTGRQIINLLKRLSKEDGKTVIVISHDQGVAAAADTTAYLLDGSISQAPPR